MISDKDIAKRVRRLYREAGVSVAHVDAIIDQVRAEFTPPSGHVPRYKPPTGRKAGLHKLMIEDGLKLNANHWLTDGRREQLVAKKHGRSQRQVHRVFKGSSDPE